MHYVSFPRSFNQPNCPFELPSSPSGAAAAEPGAPPLEDPQAPPEEPPQAQLEGPGPEPETAVDAPASSDTPIKKAVPFLLNSRFLPLRPVHFWVVALAVHLRAQICRDPHRNRGNVLGSFTAADQSIELKADGGGGGDPLCACALF
ncbi:unnamed protein product [Boreogadus saida]